MTWGIFWTVYVAVGVLLAEMEYLEHKRRRDMSQVTDQLARLKADIATNRGLVSSIVQQNTGFAQMLRDIAAKPTTGEDVEAELKELADQLEGDALSYATAITNGTAAAQAIAEANARLAQNPATSPPASIFPVGTTAPDASVSVPPPPPPADIDSAANGPDAIPDATKAS